MSLSSRSLRPLAALAVTSLAGACVHRGYPLSTTGTVDIRLDVAGSLFAADRLDADGKPAGARQDPHETGVTLYLAESGQPAYSGYVDVRVSPPEALVMKSDADEAEPTCTREGGAFRCLASAEGYARFRLSSESTWSGTAEIQVIWGGNEPKTQAITVLPAGLPAEVTDFTMIVGGLSQADRVLATFVPLQCTSGPIPADLGSKWRPGAIRSRQAYVVATAPPGQPGVLENAPVQVEALSAEAGLSLDESCAERTPRLRVLLGASGQTDPFYLCFSDNGGTVPFNITSGQKKIDPGPAVVVDPEPRLLRVRVLSTEVPIAYYPVDLFEVSAYNADRVRIAIPVDIRVGDDKVVGLNIASLTLAEESAPATVVQGTPLAYGSTVLHASPRLLDQPDCVSPTLTVAPAPITP